MEQPKVRKAVIAAAGFGTRFLPQTKAMPKEMLPLVDKPIIQYIVEELASAGIEDIIIVTGYHKRAIEDHFDHMSAELRANLRRGGKLKALEITRGISTLANFAYIRQKGPYGSATPLINAEHLIGNEPFIYTFADDFILSSPSSFRQMIDLYENTGCAVLPCIRADKDEDYDRYGFVAGDSAEDGAVKLSTIIEKPGRANAPSDLASVSGYLLLPEIFDALHHTVDDVPEGEEFRVQPAMQRLIDSGRTLLACEIKNSRYYDTGDKLEYIKTVVDFGLNHPELGPAFREYLRSVV